jgi:glycosyltransferase involved in cell wall biosynthesis
VAVEELQQYRRTQDYPTRDYWLVAGALVPYKRVDLAIRACEALGQKLIVAGQGPSLVELQNIAGKNIEFRTNVDNDEWRKLLMNAKGLLFPGIEDFGMTPVEAMALGTPVLAFKRGGALDYIKPGINGDFFNEQTVSSLVQRMQMFESQSWSQEHISHSVSVFDTRQFKHIFAEFVKEHLGSVT